MWVGVGVGGEVDVLWIVGIDCEIFDVCEVGIGEVDEVDELSLVILCGVLVIGVVDIGVNVDEIFFGGMKNDVGNEIVFVDVDVFLCVGLLLESGV